MIEKAATLTAVSKAGLEPAASVVAEGARPRPVVVHYHLFKNAGTSLDRTLRANFGVTWDEYEGAGPEIRPFELRQHLLARPWMAALSSHKALLPPPQAPGIEVIPVIFVRHPLDRIRSAYDFERKQPADTDGARAAKEMDLAGYIRWRLQRKGDRAIVNFQTHRLAKGGAGTSERERALNAVAALPFVGLVEAYARSLERLQALLSSYFPKIDLTAYRVNTTESDAVALDVRLDKLKERLGPELYRTIEAANADDLAVWQAVRDRFAPS